MLRLKWRHLVLSFFAILVQIQLMNESRSCARHYIPLALLVIIFVDKINEVTHICFSELRWRPALVDLIVKRLPLRYGFDASVELQAMHPACGFDLIHRVTVD